jgi:hypothetical protein
MFVMSCKARAHELHTNCSREPRASTASTGATGSTMEWDRCVRWTTVKWEGWAIR